MAHDHPNCFDTTRIREPEEGSVLAKVQEWHRRSAEGEALHEYLGMTQAEYAAFVENETPWARKVKT